MATFSGILRIGMLPVLLCATRQFSLCQFLDPGSDFKRGYHHLESRSSYLQILNYNQLTVNFLLKLFKFMRGTPSSTFLQTNLNTCSTLPDLSNLSLKGKAPYNNSCCHGEADVSQDWLWCSASFSVIETPLTRNTSPPLLSVLSISAKLFGPSYNYWQPVYIAFLLCIRSPCMNVMFGYTPLWPQHVLSGAFHWINMAMERVTLNLSYY